MADTTPTRASNASPVASSHGSPLPAESAFASLAAALAATGAGLDEGLAHVYRVSEDSRTEQPLAALKRSLAEAGVDVNGAVFERLLLTSVARQSEARLEAMPLPADVKALCRRAFARFAEPRRQYELGQPHFAAYCKIASLRRFPAGQFDWEVSGLPRSWVPHIRPFRALAATAALVARMRGFGPMFFFHMGTTGNNYALLEAEALRSYHRMARALALQPHIHGIMTASWLWSPATADVSPHLSWLSRFFLENGGLVATVGPADPGSGVLHRSAERRRAYESGWTPTEGLVIWPRERALAWARRHPELEV